ncbi:putative integral membrane protein [Rosellinia necatrix]|uniref:Putative integral membrane protein n=1 Tax=Rosellinia necatrix TaxID=77044 RepID=A0A1W2TNN0_ROSNE|nr:putative integral membrane protein [Rosellinia necatrix]
MSSPVLPTESPLPRPPPGPTYVTVVPVELSLRLFIASIVVTFLVLVTLVLRVVSRFYIAIKLGWDDVLVFAAALFSFGQIALFGLLVFGGLGHHAQTVPAPNQFSIPKVLFSFELLHIISMNLGKLSALFFYLKLFNNKSIARLTKGCILAVSLGSIALVLWQFLFCRPLHKMWEWNGLENCGDRQPLYVAVCVWSIFTDILALVVPLPIIWKLKMERTQKLRLSWLFAAGLSVTATSTVRLAYIVTINYHDDFSFHSVPSTFLAALEPPETILCVSLPMLYSFFARVWPGKGGGTLTASYPYAGGAHTHTYGSSLARRVDPQKRNFNPLETEIPDPFELSDMNGAQRQVKVSADRRGKGHRTLGSRSKSIDRDADSTSGSETALVEPVQTTGTEQTGGIMVSKNFTVSVSQRE